MRKGVFGYVFVHVKLIIEEVINLGRGNSFRRERMGEVKWCKYTAYI